MSETISLSGITASQSRASSQSAEVSQSAEPPQSAEAEEDHFHGVAGSWLTLDMQGDFSPLKPEVILDLLEFSFKSSSLSEITAMRGGEIALCLVGDEQIAVLNAEWRGKSYPTNVLSFPAFDVQALHDISPSLDPHPGMHLGDIILAEETVRREAEKEGKEYQDHMAHLIIHGFLHILGYDHKENSEAQIMEQLEINILQAFNISNPYQ